MTFNSVIGQLSHKTEFLIGIDYIPPLFASPLLSSAVANASVITQASPPLIFSAAIAAMSVAVQGLVDVKSPIGKSHPTSLCVVCSVDSGGRKSTVFGAFMKDVKRFEIIDVKGYQKRLKKYELELDIHNKKEKLIRKGVELDSDEQCNQLVSRLIAHEENKPIKPRLQMLSYEDTTIEALLQDASENTPNVFINTSEGGVTLKSRFMSNTPTLNLAWDGGDIAGNRKVADSFAVKGIRLSMLLMVQPSAFNRYLSISRDDVEGNGFTSRLLYCEPPSGCGSRFSDGTKHTTEGLDSFGGKVFELLVESSKLKDYKEKKTVSLSGEAKKYWLDISNDIESKMAPSGPFSNAKGHASKLAENILRLAAVFHCFEHSTGEDISLATLLDAVKLIEYYSAQYMRAFCAPPKHVVDAQLLMNWFGVQANSGLRYLIKNSILQFGPEGTRKKADLEKAMNHLKANLVVGELKVGRTKVVDLYPNLHPDDLRIRQELSGCIAF